MPVRFANPIISAIALVSRPTTLRWATFFAAAGIALGALTGLSYGLAGSVTPSAGLSFFGLILQGVLFVMLYREQSGTGQPRHRQDLAILTTIVSGILMHLTVSGGVRHMGGLSVTLQVVYWAVTAVLIPLAWMAFLILLVKDDAPLESRAMRIVAPLLAILSIARLCWTGYYLFLRTGLAWLNPASQGSVEQFVWNLVLMPALQLFVELSMIVFLIVLWTFAWRKSICDNRLLSPK